jgi:Galactose-3-O-sulfotransferase
MRRGYLRKQNFILPIKSWNIINLLIEHFTPTHLDNYLGHPAKFNKKHADGRFFVKDEHFDILTHHLRYSAKGVNKLLPKDTLKFTVLREPTALFESLYNYYRLNRSFEYGTSLKMLLESFDLQLLRKVGPPMDRVFKRIGINQVSEMTEFG